MILTKFFQLNKIDNGLRINQNVSGLNMFYLVLGLVF